MLLRSVARGQEFVLDLDCYPEKFSSWVRELLGSAAPLTSSGRAARQPACRAQ